jgi:hypothetical protein
LSDFAYFGGTDFSGAKEPLSNLWSAVGQERDGKLHILSLCPHPFRADLASFVSGGWRKALGAGEGDRVLWGADFPFGLPTEAAERIAPGAGWSAMAAWVADRPADEVRETAAGLHKTLRATDTGGAMAPLDLRIYKQTVEGIRWLHEVREAGAVSVVPQAPVPDAATVLVEVYPSATVTDLGVRCRRSPSRPGEVRARPAALRTYVTFDHPSMESVAVVLEDAWDAVFACITAWMVRGDLDQPFRLGRHGREQVEREGWIYRAPAAVGG